MALVKIDFRGHFLKHCFNDFHWKSQQYFDTLKTLFVQGFTLAHIPNTACG